MELWPHGTYVSPPSLQSPSHHTVGSDAHTDNNGLRKTKMDGKHTKACPNQSDNRLWYNMLMCAFNRMCLVQLYLSVYRKLSFFSLQNSLPGKQPKDGKKPEPCKPILKVEYKTTRAGWVIVCPSKQSSIKAWPCDLSRSFIEWMSLFHIQGRLRGHVWRPVLWHGVQEVLSDGDAWEEYCCPGDGLSHRRLPHALRNTIS
jgi:hypothetical protein